MPSHKRLLRIYSPRLQPEASLKADGARPQNELAVKLSYTSVAGRGEMLYKPLNQAEIGSW